jgi:hypothetical protein
MESKSVDASNAKARRFANIVVESKIAGIAMVHHFVYIKKENHFANSVGVEDYVKLLYVGQFQPQNTKDIA